MRTVPGADKPITGDCDLRNCFNRLYAGGYYPPRNRSWNMPSLHPHLRGYRT